MIYFDSTYVVRCYLDEPGAPEVRELASNDRIACVQWGQVEVTAAFHRKLREGAVTADEFAIVTAQFEADIVARVFNWLPMRKTDFAEIRETFATLPSETFLRAADALHLFSARKAGFTEVHTNDRHMLAAASHFGLSGVNVISAGP
jgi:predicted nucleic acid-binding protein